MKSVELTAAKFERTGMKIHGKILKMHWTLSMHCQPVSNINILYMLSVNIRHEYRNACYYLIGEKNLSIR